MRVFYCDHQTALEMGVEAKNLALAKDVQAMSSYRLV